MRRILFVSHVSEVGGAEHSLITLASRIDQSRYELHAAIPVADSPLGRALSQHGVSIHPLGHLRPLRRRDPLAPWHILRGRIELGAVVRNLQPAILHANTDVAMLYAAGLHRGPGSWRIVWHLRDMRSPGCWTRHLLDCSDARIAVSRAVLEHHGLKSSATDRVIYNGVDLSRFRPGASRQAVRTELGIPNNAFLCLCVGQSVPWKNLDRFASLSGRGYERLLITYPPPGGGGLPPIEPRPGLHVMGYRADMPDVYAAADLLVHPAIGEAFGRTVVEAMACGLPVVAYRSGGPAEIIENLVSGLLVEPSDPQALEVAVDRIVSDVTLRARLAAGALARAQAFPAEQYVLQVQALYEALLTGRLS